MQGPPQQSSDSVMGSLLSQPSPATLKRRRAVSAPCENEDERQIKRSRGDSGRNLMCEKIQEKDEDCPEPVGSSSLKGKGKEKEVLPLKSHTTSLGDATAAVIEDLVQELKCGCCTELCYNPVIVNPCQHYFCGSCCILWVRNGGTNCPACRSVSSSVTPSRILQSMVDLLLRADPSRARTSNERAQADQVYRAGTSLRLPTPRPATPEPNLESANDNFARPCPTCLPGNAYGWRCPVPIPDPAVDQEHALDLDDGMPAGHNFCGNCDQLHNVQAPTSSKCDMCQVSFCGVGIQGRCCAIGLMLQQPHGMAELQDLILSGSVYDCFQRNSVEIDILVDYLRVNEISLRGVYKEIITYNLQNPSEFIAMIDAGVFDDLHPVAGGDDANPAAPRRKVCRLCAAQVLTHGLKDWWVRERRQGNLPAEVLARKDCTNGSLCDKQADQAHAKEFNHIIQPSLPPPPPVSNQTTSAASNVPTSPPSVTDYPSSNLTNAAQELEPTSASPDANMDPPPPPQAATYVSAAHDSSQTEVDAMRSIIPPRAGESNAAASTSTPHELVPPTTSMQSLQEFSAHDMSQNGSAHGGDIIMTEIEENEAIIPRPQSMDPEALMELMEKPRAHALELSPSV